MQIVKVLQLKIRCLRPVHVEVVIYTYSLKKNGFVALPECFLQTEVFEKKWMLATAWVCLFFNNRSLSIYLLGWVESDYIDSSKKNKRTSSSSQKKKSSAAKWICHDQICRRLPSCQHTIHSHAAHVGHTQGFLQCCSSSSIYGSRTESRTTFLKN